MAASSASGGKAPMVGAGMEFDDDTKKRPEPDPFDDSDLSDMDEAADVAVAKKKKRDDEMEKEAERHEAEKKAHEEHWTHYYGDERPRDKLVMAFVMDATSSMQAHLAHIRSIVATIVAGTRDAFPRTDIKFLFVAYRDPVDVPGERHAVLELTSDQDMFRRFIEDQPAQGGGDGAEDLAGGLLLMNKELAKLEKDHHVFLYHIADAGAHGYCGENSPGYDHHSTNFQRDRLQAYLYDTFSLFKTFLDYEMYSFTTGNLPAIITFRAALRDLVLDGVTKKESVTGADIDPSYHPLPDHHFEGYERPVFESIPEAKFHSEAAERVEGFETTVLSSVVSGAVKSVSSIAAAKSSVFSAAGAGDLDYDLGETQSVKFCSLGLLPHKSDVKAAYAPVMDWKPGDKIILYGFNLQKNISPVAGLAAEGPSVEPGVTEPYALFNRYAGKNEPYAHWVMTQSQFYVQFMQKSITMPDVNAVVIDVAPCGMGAERVAYFAELGTIHEDSLGFNVPFNEAYASFKRHKRYHCVFKLQTMPCSPSDALRGKFETVYVVKHFLEKFTKRLRVYARSIAGTEKESNFRALAGMWLQVVDICQLDFSCATKLISPANPIHVTPSFLTKGEDKKCMTVLAEMSLMHEGDVEFDHKFEKFVNNDGVRNFQMNSGILDNYPNMAKEYADKFVLIDLFILYCWQKTNGCYIPTDIQGVFKPDTPGKKGGFLLTDIGAAAVNVMAFDPKTNVNEKGLGVIAKRSYACAKQHAKPVFDEFCKNVICVKDYEKTFKSLDFDCMLPRGV